MKKSWKWKLIGLLTAVFSLCIFSGCQLKESLNDKKDKFNIVAEITYHTNLNSAFIGNGNATEKTLYYTEGSPAFEPKHESELTNVTAGIQHVTLHYNSNRYALLGWYEPALDSEGNVQKDENKQIILKDTPLDLSTLRLQKNDNYTVYAKWKQLEIVVVKLVCDEDAVLYSSVSTDTKEYRNGDVIKEYAFDGNGQRTYPSALFSAKNEYTFTEFYQTADVTNADNMMRQDGDKWPINKTADEDTVIYAHYIKGEYTVLKTASSVATFFKNAGRNNAFYLLYDIDCSGITTTVNPVTLFNAQLYGNGHTLSNLKVSKSGVQQEIALFGKIGETALLKDVTFANVTVDYETDGRVEYIEIFWLFTSCVNVQSFHNVTFTGGTLTITKKNPATSVTNLYVDDTLKTDHYLYGGYNLDSDFTGTGITCTPPEVTVKVAESPI